MRRQNEGFTFLRSCRMRHKIKRVNCCYTSPCREYSIAVQLDRITFPLPYMPGSAPRSGPVFLPFVQIFFYPGAFKSFRGVREGEQSSRGSCSCRSRLNVKPEGVLSHPPPQLVLPSNAIWGVNLGDCWVLVASLFLMCVALEWKFAIYHNSQSNWQK